jgi:hypothetical protein
MCDLRHFRYTACELEMQVRLESQVQWPWLHNTWEKLGQCGVKIVW